MLRRVVTYAVVVFVIYFIATQPDTSAGFLHTWYNIVRDVGVSLARFVSSL